MKPIEYLWEELNEKASRLPEGTVKRWTNRALLLNDLFKIKRECKFRGSCRKFSEDSEICTSNPEICGYVNSECIRAVQIREG